MRDLGRLTDDEREQLEALDACNCEQAEMYQSAMLRVAGKESALNRTLAIAAEMIGDLIRRAQNVTEVYEDGDVAGREGFKIAHSKDWDLLSALDVAWKAVENTLPPMIQDARALHDSMGDMRDLVDDFKDATTLLEATTRYTEIHGIEEKLAKRSRMKSKHKIEIALPAEDAQSMYAFFVNVLEIARSRSHAKPFEYSINLVRPVI